ncbi:hypothetical protein AB1Y20_010099 [Prymnesium parvum]|uniref:AAA+ ATPase domain-containing protein n=1 Tax=Prymnesium parvum TaxID=97485 RepID=A0AB34K3H8_PRYPA
MEAAALALSAFWMRCVLGGGRPAARLAAAVGVALYALLLFDAHPSWLSLCAVLLAQAAASALLRPPHRGTGVCLLACSGSAAALSLPSPPCDPALAAALAAAAFAASLIRTLGPPLVGEWRAHPWKPVVPALVAAVVVAHGAQILPLDEFALARSVCVRFVGPQFDAMAARLALTTIHTQVLVGQLGVAYLRSAQLRKNRLLDVAHGRLRAAAFVQSVGGFILFTAAPYMAQRTLFSLLNEQVFLRFADEVENALRLDAVLATHHSLAAAAASNLTIEAHADALRQLVTTAFRIFERKVFSLPKLALFPALLYAHPLLSAAFLPLALAVDGAKASLTASLTRRIDEHRAATRRLASRRQRVEAHDAAHAEQIGAAAAAPLLRRTWRRHAAALQAEAASQAALEGLRDWVGWLYWQDVLSPSVECAVAALLEAGHAGAADVWLYARVLEDGVDALLTRSRKEAQLASLRADAAALRRLAASLAAAEGGGALRCAWGGGVAVGCAYRRGEAAVEARLPPLHAGVYALAGANGSGKSTLLALLAACARGGALPAGVAADGACEVALPSAEVVEIGSRAWCPLHLAPIEWVAWGLAGGGAAHLRAAAHAAAELRFGGGAADVARQWGEEHEDYCRELSAGQRAKLELIRGVFVRPRCPEVLLLDEVFAPLDPASKAAAMRKLKAFCTDSVVLVVYHPDSAEHREAAEQAGASVDALCEAGVDAFFDGVLEVRRGALLPLQSCRERRLAPQLPSHDELAEDHSS